MGQGSCGKSNFATTTKIRFKEENATVYKTQATKYNVAINLQSDGNKSSMVLMEIAQ